MPRIARNDKICAHLNRTLHYFVVVGVSGNVKSLSRHNYSERTLKTTHGICRLGQIQSKLSSPKNLPTLLEKRLGTEAPEAP
jgi:hypothetical protein